MEHLIQKKTEFGIVIVVLLALAISTACTPSSAIEPTGQPEQVKMVVGPEKVDCVGEGPMTCLQVKFDGDSEWMLFYDNIAGFEFEPGFEYELLVTKTEVEDPPAGASSIQYALVEVVGKTAVETVAGLANPASVYCEEQGGTLEIRSDEAGNQYGVCIFEDGSECEEWAFFQGECQPGETEFAG